MWPSFLFMLWSIQSMLWYLATLSSSYLHYFFPHQSRTPIMSCMKYHTALSTQTVFSGLSWSTSVSDSSLQASWVWYDRFYIPGFGGFLLFFSGDPLKLRLDGNVNVQVSAEMLEWVQSGLSLEYSRMFKAVPTVLSFSCWKVNLWLSLRSWAGFTWMSVSLFRLVSLSPDSLQLPAPCVTDEMVLGLD